MTALAAIRRSPLAAPPLSSLSLLDDLDDEDAGVGSAGLLTL